MFDPYRARFEANRSRPLPAVEAPPLSEARRAALARSLAVFQLGETGEGRIAKQLETSTLPLVDDDYRAAMKLFVAEEGRHARILALMVRALGGRLLTETWTRHLFVIARRLAGIRLKVLVLLSAEVIALGYYGLLQAALPEGPMAAALEQIRGDERVHFELHCDFLSGQPRVFRWLWRPVATAAALTVLIDHRRTLAAFGVPVRAAAASLLGLVAEAARRMRPGQRAPYVTQLRTLQVSASSR